MASRIEALISPRSVAVVGASPRAGSLGFRVIQNLRAVGFSGRITPVNPRHREVAGLACCASIDAVEDPPDVAVLAVPAATAIDLVPDMAKAGVRALVIPAGGYDDAGTTEGRELQEKLKSAAAAHRLVVCGPNNMGIINVHERVALWTATQRPEITPGRLAVISQSGSVAIALSQDERRLGLAYVISSGNEACLTAADYLSALANDDHVGVIALFLETVRDPQLFSKAAHDAFSNGKRIVALKVGRTDAGRAAVAAHTGALAGEQDLYDAYFQKCGILAARDFEELTELSALCLSSPEPPRTANAVILTLSGGEAALAADIGADVGLSLPPMSGETAGRLTPVLPPLSKARNPLDAWGLGWNPEHFELMLSAIAADDNVGVIAISVDAPASGGGDAQVSFEMAKIAVQASSKARIVFINNISGAPNVQLAKVLEPRQIPCLVGMRTALAAIAKWTSSKPSVPAQGTRHSDRSFAPDVAEVNAILERGADPERFAILRSFGVPMAPCIAVGSPDEAVASAEERAYPVVLKGTAPSIAHRSELDLVRLELRTPDDVRRAHSQLAAALERHAAKDPERAVVLQPMIRSGIELIIGIRNEPGFGTLVLAGLGGIYTEILRDTAVAFAPIDVETAEDMLRRTRAGAFLAGARGRPPYDMEATAKALVALAELGAATQNTVAAIEVNPFIVLEKGQGAIGVDVFVEARATR